MERELRGKGLTDRKIHEAIEEKLGVPRSTARGIIAKFYGPEVNMCMLPCKYREITKGRGRRHPLADEINRMICAEPFIMQFEIIAQLKILRPQFAMTAASLSKIMKSEGWRQRVARVKGHASMVDQLRYLKEINSVLDCRQLVFIDETAKDRNAARRNKIWTSLGNEPVVVGSDPYAKSRYTLIAAVDIDGFIPEMCHRVFRKNGNADTDPTHMNVTQDLFDKWFEVKVLPLCGRYSLSEPRSVVVLDNCGVHKSDALELMCSQADIRLIWTSPYSPELNPIEPCFHQYKASLLREAEKTDTEMMQSANHSIALGSVTRENMVAYYHKMLQGYARHVPRRYRPQLGRALDDDSELGSSDDELSEEDDLE